MIKYKVIERKNPADRTADAKYYVTPVNTGVIELDDLSTLISDGSTVRQSDVYAVLIGMVNAISKQLAEGKLVKLGKLGSFSIGLNSEGTEKPEDATANSIKRTKIRYRPAAELRNMLKSLSFSKIKEK